VTRWVVRLTRTARRDFAGVIATIAENSGSLVAARWRGRILGQIGHLADRPYLGARDEDLGSGRRRLIVAPYLIVYELMPANVVAVLRIIHGARDLPALFGDGRRD
jgi:plasmid stabilization system protein ParE